MEQFASGWKKHYYGKGDVTVYRLHRQGTPAGGASAVFGANVLMLVYGDAFWPTYTKGDNSALVATDSMKNFIQRETMNFDGGDLEDFAWFIADKFLDTYAQVEGVQVTATEVPYAALPSADGRPESAPVAFSPSGAERAYARIEIAGRNVVESVSGIRGFKLLRLGGSAFHGFVRDEYTTLPDLTNRPLHMWLDLEWRYADAMQALSRGQTTALVRRIVHDTFRTFESGSIQQVIHRMGTRLMNEVPAMAEIHLEANNRTWDTIAEQGEAVGVYTDPRPPYGCLGLRLKR